ncbi:MAG: hypothetical protein KC621_00635, partial [Myxococcales bacterium]|nr:hypothetical protein [Myxococcales bacterium]
TPTPPETPPTAQPAVEQLLSAARQALDHGDHRGARQLAARAWAQLPDDPEHRTLRVATLLELATSAWHGSGDHATLEDARSLAEQAAALLTTDDDASLVASVLSVLAGVLADQGEPEGLSRAVDLLTDAIRRLQDAGDPLGAAALLDDQAAVWVRLGDPVRAAHLLRTSRDLFAQRAASEPEARRQLARTELTLARLPLHARPRKGLEQESLQAALTSARSARDAFQALQLPQELGRALQTEGRLLALLDSPEEAVATLAEAARLQQGMGDALGLAGTAGALAELHAARGEPGTALKLLSDSIELNRRAGSALGLAYNRAALEGLRELGGPAVQRLDAQLEAAQRVVGRRPR